MRASTFLRIILLPAGILFGMWELGKAGSRDLVNRLRFPASRVDRGACIDRLSCLEGNVRIHQDVYVNASRIGRYTYIGRGSLVQHARVGRFCSIANEVLIGLASHPTDRFSTSPMFYKANCPLGRDVVVNQDSYSDYAHVDIGHDVWIGSRAIVLGGVRIGNGAVVAANSVVTSDVPDFAIVAGTPARQIRFRLSETHRAKLAKAEWWNLDIDELKQTLGDLGA